VLAAAVAFVGLSSPSAKAVDLLYDWQAVNAATTPVVGFTPAPFLNHNNVAAVATQLQAQQGLTPGKVAVKILDTSLTPTDYATIFNNPNFKVDYTFLDIEGQSTATVQGVAQAIHAQPKSATNSYVGNFNFYPGAGDNSSGFATPLATNKAYGSGGSTGVNMANEGLYPGASGFNAVPGSGGTGANTSTSPNIRSALFTLPIVRASYVTANLPAGHKHIPYINRFNNQPSGVTNGTYTDPNTGQQLPAFYFDATHGTANQLLSRGDVSALVAHYRARGVDGVHLLDGGVVGYSQSDFETDAKAGFTFAPFANILNGSNPKIATLDTVARVDGSTQSVESTGVVFSGVYSLTQNSGLGKLALLVSNLDDNPHGITFPNTIGGKSVSGTYQVLAGQHKLLEFTGAGTQWTLLGGSNIGVFADAARDGVGVPEPVAMAGASIFGMSMLLRRRRSRTA